MITFFLLLLGKWSIWFSENIALIHHNVWFEVYEVFFFKMFWSYEAGKVSYSALPELPSYWEYPHGQAAMGALVGQLFRDVLIQQVLGLEYHDNISLWWPQKISEWEYWLWLTVRMAMALQLKNTTILDTVPQIIGYKNL